MDQRSVLSFIVMLSMFHTYLCKGGKKVDDHVKEKVIIVGGGMAGLSAARRLMEDGRFDVRVLEGRRNRYGGRVWTHRKAMKNAKGVDVNLGAMFLNTQAVNNTLHKLAKDYELKTQNAGLARVYFQEEDGKFRMLDGETVTKLYTAVFKIIISAIKKVQKAGKDQPLSDIIKEEMELYYAETKNPDFDEVLVSGVLNSLPAAQCRNFSSLLYEVNNEFGWDSILVDGADVLVDRIVAGSGLELPVKVDLNKVVRNIAVDKKRGKVLVRTSDRKQEIADAVIVALPIGVLKSDSVVFDPRLSGQWYNAINDLGIAHSNKVIVGFDQAFWPKDIGSFNILSNTTSDGFLQMWTNAYRVSGNPVLIGKIFGDQAKKWETANIEELKEKVKTVLGEMFGTETVAAHTMTTFLLSNWATDPLVMGSMSYPKAGSKTILWDILKRPACPYVYFAGAYTETQGYVDSLHGAYNSGVRAADQIISNVCNRKNSVKQTTGKSKGGKSNDGKGKKSNKSDNKEKKKIVKDTSQKDEL